MSDTYYFIFDISTGLLPKLLMIVLFLAFIVGLFTRSVRNF